MKKVPLRTCTVTKEKCEKKDLLRVVRMPDGKAIDNLRDCSQTYVL